MCHRMPPPLFVLVCAIVYTPNKHALLSGILTKKHTPKAQQPNPVQQLCLYLYHYCDSSHLSDYFPLGSHKCTGTYSHGSLILTERTSLISKARIWVTHCLFSLNNNVLNTFFNCQWQNLSGFTFHRHGMWSPGIPAQLVKSSHELAKAGTQTMRRTISWSQVLAV